MDLKDDELRGSYPPLITPFRNGNVDYDAFAELLERQIRDGSHGVLVNGTSSEPASLTVAERNRLVTTAVQQAAGRIPVVAATGSQSLAETIELTRHADAAGASATMVVTPYYIKPPQRGLVAYYRAVAEHTSKPIMMYHIPGRTAVTATAETLCQIAEAVPHFVGMKHASTDFGLVTDVLKDIGPQFRVFVGLEDLSFPMLCVGACGLMNAVGNVSPGKVAQLYEAVAAGDLRKGRTIHEELWGLNRAIFFDTNPIPMKYVMWRMGVLADNEHRLPLSKPTQDVAARLDDLLRTTPFLASEASRLAA